MSDDSGEAETVAAGMMVHRAEMGTVASAADLPVVMAHLKDVAMERAIRNEISRALAV